jgi:hypothetical protein
MGAAGTAVGIEAARVDLEKKSTEVGHYLQVEERQHLTKR